MKFSAIVMAFAIAAMFAVGSTLASSQTTTPIQVLNLQYQPDVGDEDEGGSSFNFRPGIMVTFKDVTPKPVHAVVFAILDSSGFQLGTVSRHGTFSPGVDITRYFGDVKLKDKHGVPAKATPVQVGFKDGTTWNATK
jgi:hypothetical protein